MDFYVKYNKNLEKWITNRINDNYIFLYTEDSEFRNLAHSIYHGIVSSVKEIEGNGEMVFKFLKDYHRIHNKEPETLLTDVNCGDIDQWVTDTYKVYGVNLGYFCYDWVYYFNEHEELWEKGRSFTKTNYYHLPEYRNKTYETTEYDYKKEGDRFGLSALYHNMPKKEFTIGREKSFEILMMYFWLKEIEVDEDKDYWNQYLSEVAMKQ